MAEDVIEDAKEAVADAAEATGTDKPDLKQQASDFAKQAAERAKTAAAEGKARAGEALHTASRLMDDAAKAVDEKLGSSYGQYAHSAAEKIADFGDTLQTKELDELIEDAQNFVRKSPAIAIGIAAALGFVVARLVKAGLDHEESADPGDGNPA
ncbi:hypothetical protein [Sphingomonas sp.]|uniref:hypothetical protein n=1 Tax=Sphingomonas sp. TaxID=28214 RepID=UPI001D1E55BD|nr:hypothetical protein [Sphingomonas sp.]MBX9795669.1 hypothetical protein [Sphingomonas sp.]